MDHTFAPQRLPVKEEPLEKAAVVGNDATRESAVVSSPFRLDPDSNIMSPVEAGQAESINKQDSFNLAADSKESINSRNALAGEEAAPNQEPERPVARMAAQPESDGEDVYSGDDFV